MRPMLLEGADVQRINQAEDLDLGSGDQATNGFNHDPRATSDGFDPCGRETPAVAGGIVWQNVTIR
jgi:hypothetical protein